MPLSRRHFIQSLTAGLGSGAVCLMGAKSAIATPDWSYGSDTGPQHWSALSPDYQLCGTGQHQSPIDVDALSSKSVNWRPHYWPSPLVLVNTGHTIRADCAPGSTLSLDGEAFELIQFHFHTPSEHTRSGQHQPMEIHFVHRQPETGALLVLGIWAQVGQPNPTLDRIGAKLPQQPAVSALLRQPVDAAALLPKDTTALRYSGSLTTPP